MSLHKNIHHTTPSALTNGFRDTLQVNGYHVHSRRSTTPNGFHVTANPARFMNTIEGDGAEEDPRSSVFRDLYKRSEARLASLFNGQDKEQNTGCPDREERDDKNQRSAAPFAQTTSAPKAPARKIDEDDYDDSEGEEEEDSASVSPLRSRRKLPSVNLTPYSTAMLRGLSSNSTPASTKAGKTTEEARKRLEEDKKATEDEAKRNLDTFFYTLENDRDTMLEQNKLEESERQVDAEMSGANVGGNNGNGPSAGNGQQGTLSQTNLGASSLTLKNLIKRIDARRNRVHASDIELRNLIGEVRKNRGKWNNEERVGQAELYEAAEKVLNELKAMTEHSGPFLTRVNKREAPDYYHMIKHPMDLGTMTKKLKSFSYKSKQEFVDDLSHIWTNCLKYNASPEHYLRKKALAMRKETEKLVPLIPAIVIRDRAEVEAEERRVQNGGLNLDEEDSDDEPIISSRGRKAPSKMSKKGTVARKAPGGGDQVSPLPDAKPVPLLNGISSHLKHEPTREDSESAMDGSQNTPPPGSITPAGVNGILSHGAAGTQSDVMDVDGESLVNGLGGNERAEDDDPEYKIWKQVTKKDRALVTAERHRLFKGEQLDPDAPALLRTKLGMRRWLRKQREGSSGIMSGKRKSSEVDITAAEESEPRGGETLAEGIEGEEERVLPDYYDVLAAIPDISHHLHWSQDSEGNVQDLPETDKFLRVLPKGLFLSPESNLTKKIEENLRQIQKTRKLTSKIGVVKQMQLQSQMYQGQFQKHEIVPLLEQDIEPHVAFDEGPVVAPHVCRAALQRSTAKLLVHAGFDEFQPSALDTITEMAGDYFTKLARTLNEYAQAPKVAVPTPCQHNEITWKERFTTEEAILHTLRNSGADVNELDTYVTEDVERTGSRLTFTHDKMKAHLAELLRPALHDAGPDGSNAFNDGSEQFVGGDFADELGEDFFGFKELGLDLEFGMASLSVPLHLLQARISNVNQTQNPSALSSSLPSLLPPPTTFTPVTIHTIKNEIGLVRNFFLAKLHANNDQPLVEDDDLPQKQRFPKPRLPPTGKITSPRKRPLKEQGPGKGHPRKKLKLNDGEAKDAGEKGDESQKENQKEGDKGKDGEKEKDIRDVPILGKPIRNGVVPNTDPVKNKDPGTPTPKGKGKEVNGESGGMISPESLEAT